MIKNTTSTNNKSYAFWARFNQILVIVQGIFTLPIGVIFIIASAKLNNSIEIANRLDLAQDSEIRQQSQELINSVKGYHKYMSIGVLATMIIGILFGIMFVLFFLSILNQLEASVKNGTIPNTANSIRRQQVISQ
jgi:hypothetical protein